MISDNCKCFVLLQEVFKDAVSFEKFCSYLKRLELPTKEFFQLLFDWVGTCSPNQIYYCIDGSTKLTSMTVGIYK